MANLYLHWFDALFHGPQGPARKAAAKLVRNADDFVELAKQMESETIEFIEPRLEGKFQSEINREKTRIEDLREEGGSLNFLGYTFRWDRDRKGRDRKYLNVFGYPISAYCEIERHVQGRLIQCLQRRSQRPY